MSDPNVIKIVADAAMPFIKLDINTVANGLILALVISGVKRLGAIRDHLGMLNGNVKKLEQWKCDHLSSEEQLVEALRAGEIDCKANFRREIDALWRSSGYQERRTEKG